LYSRISFSIPFTQNALWELPYTNVYSTITPDMLHQVKKGVWEHLVNLTLDIIRESYVSRKANQLILELDLRIRLVPRYSGLRKFSKGISHLSQITAAEYQQIMRVC
jgi:Tfp pilus assembly protein PilO